MKYTFKSLAAVLLVTAFALNSCDEDVTEVQPKQNETILTEDVEKNPLVIDGKKMEWNFSLQPRKLTKGMLVDEIDWYSYALEVLRAEYGDDYKLVDTLRFSYKNQNYEIKLLRVDRKSEPGKYFYVMIDNLDVKLDTACWAYGDDERNVSKYGRLYTWNAANALANEISMRLPVYEANNPTQKKFGGRLQMPVKARLLSRQDICDIIECDTIGFNTRTGYTLDDQNEDWVGHGMDGLPLFYYDVFVGGLEGPHDGEPIDYSRGEHTLGGFRNPHQQPEWAWPYWDADGWYIRKDVQAFIWTLEYYKNTSIFDSHYTFEISRMTTEHAIDNYSAYINVLSAWNQYGYSVRYVFEPQYK